MNSLSELNTRFIFVVGGGVSGIGKGITVASTANILQGYGYRVSCIKIDPYFNCDAGTMNPVEHGEVFVTDDGMETDQDIGTYERFLNQDILSTNYMTNGSVFKSAIDSERRGDFLGKCVELIPHITDEEIKKRLLYAAKQCDAEIMLVEIGGTVGEIQNAWFLETARRMRDEAPDKVLFILVSIFLYLSHIGELKSKLTQSAVLQLSSSNLRPDFIIGRIIGRGAPTRIHENQKKKVSVACSIPEQNIISAPDVDSIYDVPVNFEKEGLGEKILAKFKLQPRKKANDEWLEFVKKEKSADKPIRIGIAGKYFVSGDGKLSDAYISVIEAIKHASFTQGLKPKIEWLDVEEFESNPSAIEKLCNFDGIIVPGGFGTRGVEGKINVIKFVRENKIPFLGLCLGMQLAVVEFTRNVCRIKDTNTTEIDKNTSYPVIHTMEDQVDKIEGKENLGGTMRLGAYNCRLPKYQWQRDLAYELYRIYWKPNWKEDGLVISERHRHRYELNNNYRNILNHYGLRFGGINPEKNLVEIIELPDHPFFVGTQFHPEFKSRPLNPHPLFMGFVKAASDFADKERE